MFRFYRTKNLGGGKMVEWNINHRMMADKVNSSISNYDFEGLAEWFNDLDENFVVFYIADTPAPATTPAK